MEITEETTSPEVTTNDDQNLNIRDINELQPPQLDKEDTPKSSINNNYILIGAIVIGVGAYYYLSNEKKPVTVIDKPKIDVVKTVINKSIDTPKSTTKKFK